MAQSRPKLLDCLMPQCVKNCRWKFRQRGHNTPPEISTDCDRSSPINQLPPEILIKIFGYLSETTILRTTRFVCRNWFHLCRDRRIWKNTVGVVNDRGCNNVGCFVNGITQLRIDYFCNHNRRSVVPICLKCLGSQKDFETIEMSYLRSKKEFYAHCLNVAAANCSKLKRIAIKPSAPLEHMAPPCLEDVQRTECVETLELEPVEVECTIDSIDYIESIIKCYPNLRELILPGCTIQLTVFMALLDSKLPLQNLQFNMSCCEEGIAQNGIWKHVCGAWPTAFEKIGKEKVLQELIIGLTNCCLKNLKAVVVSLARQRSQCSTRSSTPLDVRVRFEDNPPDELELAFILKGMPTAQRSRIVLSRAKKGSTLTI